MSFVPFQDLRSGENLIQVSTKPAPGHNAGLYEPLLPAPDGGLGHARLAHDLARAVAIGGQQHDPGAPSVLLRSPTTASSRSLSLAVTSRLIPVRMPRIPITHHVGGILFGLFRQGLSTSMRAIPLRRIAA